MLQDPHWEEQWKALRPSQDPQKWVSPLFSALFSTQDTIHWHAVTCFGDVVCDLAQWSMESARVIMRRFLWSLNDESGGIGWGAPEAMGEIMARHQGLAREYSSILLSFICPCHGPDNFLEYDPLRQGAHWGIARLAQDHPLLVQPGEEPLAKALGFEHHAKSLLLICLALEALSSLSPQTVSMLRQWTADTRSVSLYWNARFHTRTLGRQAEQTLDRHLGSNHS